MTPEERAKCYERARGETADEAIARLKTNCGEGVVRRDGDTIQANARE